MTNKEQLIDAIENSIVENGTKGITANVVRNLLLSIIELIPEPEQKEETGSGQIVFYYGLPDEQTGEFVLTQQQKEHNAKMYKIVKNSDVSLQASIDISDMYARLMQQEGIYVADLKYNTMSFMTAYIPPEAASLMGEVGGVALIGEGGTILVQADGSIIPSTSI